MVSLALGSLGGHFATKVLILGFCFSVCVRFVPFAFNYDINISFIWICLAL